MTAVYLYIRNNNVENRITLKFSVAEKIKEQNICCKFAMREKKLQIGAPIHSSRHTQK